MRKFADPDVARKFKSYPPDVAAKLSFLRQLIFDLASEIPDVGKLQETLKWGQPSYLTIESKSGSTIRIDQRKGSPEEYAVYFHCQTDLVETAKKLYPSVFSFEGKRALIFHVKEELPVEEISHCLSLALTYHLRKAGR